MRRLHLLASTGIVLLTGAQAPAPSAQSILAAAKAAMGGAALDRLSVTHDTGRLSAGGLSGSYDDRLDWVHVKQALTYDLGPASGGQGWDGTAAWSTDSSKQVRVESSAEAIASAVGGAYAQTYAMLFANRYPAKVEYAGPKLADGTTYQAVRVTPAKGDPVDVWFDPQTHLPVRVVELTGGQPQTTLLSDYRTVLGVKLPFHTVLRTANDPKYDQVTDTTAVVAVAAVPEMFAPPKPPAYDAQFPAGKSAVTVPFRLLNNHIYLQVSIDGHPAEPMMFDTGAINFLDAAHAASLGLHADGALPGGGFGSSVSATGLAKAKTVSVGGLTLHDQVFATSDLGALRGVEGTDAAGLIGYEFAKRAVLTIDYANRTLTFTRPDAFIPPAGLMPEKFTFSAHVPMVNATVDGIGGEFEIDTGSRGALTLMHPFAQAHGLVAKYGAHRLATTGYGVGGPSKALLARVGDFSIGAVTLHQQIADLVQDEHGAAAAEHTAGNIGGDILKRFTLSLDYGHQALYFAPNALAATPGVFDRSGLWVNRAADGMIAIADVTDGSAAAKSGLAVGTEITAVNGHDARTVELSELRDTLKGKVGSTVRLIVKTAGGKERKVPVVLADQV